jgi:hypothetical protein
MVKIDLDENEIKAIDALMKDCKTDIEMGFILYTLKKKIFDAWKEKFESDQQELAQKMLKEKKHEEKVK